MTVKTKIEPFSRDIDLVFSDMLSPKAISTRIAEVARGELVRAQNLNRAALGYLPKHATFVDRRPEAPLESVRPDGGEIVFEFELLETALVVIAEMLNKASPYRKGGYTASHALFADDTEVVPGEIPPNASQYAFTSTVPYARKIERGLSDQAPEGVYQVVATLAASRFGNIARIRFGYKSVPFGAIGGWAGSGSAKALARRVRGGDPNKHPEWLTRQPAIIITMGGR